MMAMEALRSLWLSSCAPAIELRAEARTQPNVNAPERSVDRNICSSLIAAMRCGRCGKYSGILGIKGRPCCQGHMAVNSPKADIASKHWRLTLRAISGLMHRSKQARREQYRRHVERDSRNGTLWNIKLTVPDHCSLIPANLTTLAHFSVSAAMNFPSSSGAIGISTT